MVWEAQATHGCFRVQGLPVEVFSPDSKSWFYYLLSTEPLGGPSELTVAMKGSHYNTNARKKANTQGASDTCYRSPNKQESKQQWNPGPCGHSPAAPSPADSHAYT